MLSNEELQAAINKLVEHFAERSGWCEGGSPDGAASDVLAGLLYEQLSRVRGE